VSACETVIMVGTLPGSAKGPCGLPGRWCGRCKIFVCRYHWVTWHFEHPIDPPFMRRADG